MNHECACFDWMGEKVPQIQKKVSGKVVQAQELWLRRKAKTQFQCCQQS